MKTATLLFVWGLLYCSPICAEIEKDSLSMQFVAEEMEAELTGIHQDFEAAEAALQVELAAVNHILENGYAGRGMSAYLQAMNRKLELRDKMDILEDMYQLSMAKARYRKGLELVKLMYEKILGLDHHFYSLETYNNIAQMTNPNAYPDFQKSKGDIEKRLKKNNKIRLPNLLSSNPLMSATFSLMASFVGEGEPRKKEKDLEEVACILDFTVRMYADLNLIFYETEFLKESNNSLKADCLQLFKDYAKIIGYKVALDVCRADDDWETVYDKLDLFITEMEANAVKSKDDPAANRNLMKGIANLEFSIDRLLDFLEKYNAFIAQGGKYYQKFEVIVSNYQNEAACAGQLPHQFSTLKQDIKYSIEKFNEAYNIAELNGSKLKDLLYGIED
ncbi:MAG TPA: hypothetical protein ENJ95_06530 [Bacteroidetes bacterium]|nr:hypothetical protein [Bacteroidota bacterium]